MSVVADVERLQAMIAARLGLRFDPRQLPWLADLLGRLAGGAVPPYLDRLEIAPVELDALIPELTVGETYFFRHAEQFRALRLDALPALLRARRPQRRLSVLSAGCASGEEVWSLAICLQAQLGLEREPWQWEVLGLDINPEALAKAEAARYGSWSLRELPGAPELPWFQAGEATTSLHPALSRHVRFERRNLCLDDPLFWRPGAFDVIFCRNVLMYLTPEAMQAALARLCGALAPGGYLFLGHAESLRELDIGLRMLQSEGCFYYQRAEPVVAAPTIAHVPAAAPWQPWPAPWPAPAIGLAAEVQVLLAPTPTPTPAVVRRISPPAAIPRAAPAPLLDLLRRERHDDALALTTSLAAAAPPDAELLLHQALLLAQQGRLDEAERACERLLVLQPPPGQRAATHYVQALCLEARSDTAGAGLRHRQAARLDPGFAMPRLRQGLLARKRGELVLMRSELEAARRLLQDESEHRLLLFGGGFGREALLALCEGELQAVIRLEAERS